MWKTKQYTRIFIDEVLLVVTEHDILHSYNNEGHD